MKVLSMGILRELREMTHRATAPHLLAVMMVMTMPHPLADRNLSPPPPCTFLEGRDHIWLVCVPPTPPALAQAPARSSHQHMRSSCRAPSL